MLKVYRLTLSYVLLLSKNKNQKMISEQPCSNGETTRHTVLWEGIRTTHKDHTLSGKLDCLCACEDRASSPTLTVFVNFQTLSTIINRPSSVNSWLIVTMVLSTVG
jgi:hypothetical protein